MDDETLARFAELAVDFGANLQPGQVVSLSGAPGKEQLVRAIANRAYQKGAKFVDLAWFDPWIKRARIEFAPDDTLEYVPPWLGERVLTLGRERGATACPRSARPARSSAGARSTGRSCPARRRPGRTSCIPAWSRPPRWPS